MYTDISNICVVSLVDTYVGENPVPEEYARMLLLENNNYVSDGGRVTKITADSFKRKSYSGKWSGRGGGSKQRRRK